ncbi:LytR/AlgR family response regulator transcription factor [Ferruginibacter profundus]
MEQTRYNDTKLFLWLIPFINIINYYLTYVTFNPLWRLLVTFSIDTIQGYIAWLLVRVIILWLDRKISFEASPVKRIAVQLVLTLLAGSATLIILTEFTNWLATSKPVPLSFYTKDMPIISIWFFVVNGIYIGLYYHQKWQQSEQRIQEERKIKNEGFKIVTPKKELLVSFEEIGGFYIDGDYSVVVTVEKKKHLLDFSLDKVEKNLPESSFFRLNRQYIIHRQLVTGFEKGENGKINVLLKDAEHLPSVIPVSRTKAPEFKSWFTPN